MKLTASVRLAAIVCALVAVSALTQPTGQAQGWRGDVVAVAKRDLNAGEILDGEGGYTVWGKLLPAERSLAEGALPIGLAHHVRLTHDIAAGGIVYALFLRQRGPA